MPMPNSTQVRATTMAKISRLSPAMASANWLILLERPVAVIIWTTTPMQAITTAMLATVRPPFSKPARSFLTKACRGFSSRMTNCWISPTNARQQMARKSDFCADSPMTISTTRRMTGIINTSRLRKAE